MLLFNLSSCAILIKCVAVLRHAVLRDVPALLHERAHVRAAREPMTVTHAAQHPAKKNLRRKSIAKRGAGFGYGFMCAMCFTLAFFTLLCGLVLDGFKDVVASELEVKLSGSWSKYNTGEYLGATALAYICFVMFMAFFLALVLFQGAVSEQLGIGAGAFVFFVCGALAHRRRRHGVCASSSPIPAHTTHTHTRYLTHTKKTQKTKGSLPSAYAPMPEPMYGAHAGLAPHQQASMMMPHMAMVRERAVCCVVLRCVLC